MIHAMVILGIGLVLGLLLTAATILGGHKRGILLRAPIWMGWVITAILLELMQIEMLATFAVATVAVIIALRIAERRA